VSEHSSYPNAVFVTSNYITVQVKWDELHYIAEEKSKKIAEGILKLEKDVKFIEHAKHSDGRFKMLTKSKKAES